MKQLRIKNIQNTLILPNIGLKTVQQKELVSFWANF